MTNRTVKVTQTSTAQGTKAFTYFGYEDGVCVQQGRKLWRSKGDCNRAAKAWQAKGD